MAFEIDQALDAAEAAQATWAGRMVRRRLKIIGAVAPQIATSAASLADSIQRPNASRADLLSSEIVPLADACRFTARQGRQILAPRTYSWRHAAWWMGLINVSTIREPWGVVLILAPSNYPLYLPGVQIIQALAAGNAVLVKPAEGGRDVLLRFKQCLQAVGVPGDLVQVLPTDISAGTAAIEQGVDKVILTGSVGTGRQVLRSLAESLTPSTMELSGCDAAFVTPQADVKRAARAIAFGFQLNGGATCIAPRRIFVTPKNKAELCELLLEELRHSRDTAANGQDTGKDAGRSFQVSAVAGQAVVACVKQAIDGGAKLIAGELPQKLRDSQAVANKTPITSMSPIVLDLVRPDMKVARTDLFAPITSIITVPDMATAVNQDRLCPYSLGASVFGPRSYAEHWAAQLSAGCVVINDVIAPTADPRVAFGGRDHSGWGVTRGAEGLLEMSRPKTICIRRGKWLPHLEPQGVDDAQLLQEILTIRHALSLRVKWSALRRLIRLGRESRS
jgi:acyl-CoA reductase-like NAD-dependent aldehyde dehydrogenase